MALKDEWKKIKKDFEAATGKKKPTEKLAGVFRKGTGLEALLESIDKAKTKEELKKACNAFGSKKTEYVKLLKQNQVDSTNVNYKVEIDKMILELEDLEQKGAERLNHM